MVLELCPHSHIVLTLPLSSGPAISGTDTGAGGYTALPGLMQPIDDLLIHTSGNDAKNITQVHLFLIWKR